MLKFAPIIILIASIFTMTATANAGIKIVKCEGIGRKETYGNTQSELPSKIFYFKLDDKLGSVPWAVYDNIKNINMQQLNKDTIEFVAFLGDVNNSYSYTTTYKFIISRISGQGAIDIFHEQNHKLELEAVYGVDCHITDKAF